MAFKKIPNIMKARELITKLEKKKSDASFDIKQLKGIIKQIKKGDGGIQYNFKSKF